MKLLFKDGKQKKNVKSRLGDRIPTPLTISLIELVHILEGNECVRMAKEDDLNI